MSTAGTNTAEKYLRPEVIRQVARLDLRAKFIVEGFLTGLHGSPFQGFSVEFSEHRKYVPGDDLKDLDWQVYAKTGKYYVRKYRAETNMTGWLVMDLSESMGYPYDDGKKKKDDLNKFEYGICLAAALAYLMIHQQDPVGLMAFDEKVRTVLPPKSKRSQLGTMLSVLAGLKPTGKTDVAGALTQVASLARGKSLVMLFSDLLSDPDPIIKSLYRLRHAGHEVILFHILDKAEVTFPFRGRHVFEDPETGEQVPASDDDIENYLANLNAERDRYRHECGLARADYVTIDTGIGFEKALMDYLILRQRRFA